MARYGGEEFAILARGITLKQAVRMSERVREAVEDLEIKADGELIEVTISAGVATLNPTPFANPGALIFAADRALYSAKDRGRNRVERAER